MTIHYMSVKRNKIPKDWKEFIKKNIELLQSRVGFHWESKRSDGTYRIFYNSDIEENGKDGEELALDFIKEHKIVVLDHDTDKNWFECIDPNDLKENLETFEKEIKLLENLHECPPPF
jgi:hypothetical protein